MLKKMSNDLWVGGGVTLLALITIGVIIPYGVTDPGTVEFMELAPAFWPQIIMILLALIGTGIMGSEIYLSQKKQAVDDIEEASEEKYPITILAIRFIVAFGLLFLTYLFIEYLGMVLSTAISLACFMLLGKVRDWKMIIGLSVFLPCFLYAFFVYVANVPLPIGDLFYSFM